MYKKIAVPLILALVAALGFSNVAFAASSSVGSARFTGTILSVDMRGKTFRIDTITGARITFRVDDTSLYKGLAGSLAELKPAMYVKIVAAQHENGTYRALSVNVLKLSLKGKVNGKVTGLAKTSFTILGDNGIAYSFHVMSGTVFRGAGLNSFGDLSLGMPVRVNYTDLKSGVIRALDVTLR